MQSRIESRLEQLGIELPNARPPVANYASAVISGCQIYVAGQICAWNGEYRYIGLLGSDISLADGQKAARLCGLNIIAQLRSALGDLDRVKRCIKLTVFVRSAAAFIEQSKVANGASDLLVEVFGDAGKHVRSAVGVTQLPFGACAEVDAVFEVA